MGKHRGLQRQRRIQGQPAAAMPPARTGRQQQREGEGQDPELNCSCAARHVRRADLQGIIQFAKPTKAGMTAPKIMTSA